MALTLTGKIPKTKKKDEIHPQQNTLESFFKN